MIDAFPKQDIVENEAFSLRWEYSWPENTHEFIAVIHPEAEGGYSVYALRYPGVISQGETEHEAKQNIGEAFLLMLETVRDLDQPLAFDRGCEVPEDASLVRVTVVVDD